MGKSFVSAFLEWFAASNLGDVLRPEPRHDQDAVNLHFHIGDGSLEGWVNAHDLSIGAILNGECHDLIYTDELVAEQSDEGWRCSLCLDDPPKWYPALEQLWIAHCFKPFGRWCDEELRGAPGIAFYGEGITWAKLEEPKDDAAHFQSIEWPRAAR